AGRGVRDRSRRHRRRLVSEHLGRNRIWHQASQARRKQKRREKPPAPPASADAIAPGNHRHAFHRKRGKFKPDGCGRPPDRSLIRFGTHTKTPR
ncbi:hypothetical protein, partial [Bradyrhizobium sp.]|uniref:hypothetical protein n=1 Tax=Bradyrhizobium sp. TaxID=376 RepID=UPI003C77EB85